MKNLLKSALLMLPLVACTPGFEGQYSDPGKTEIINDKWNDTDATKTAQVMVKSMIDKEWLSEFMSRKKGQKPFVVVGDVENRTDEHIDTQALTEAIYTELVNSRKVRFLAKKDRDKVLDEIKYQQSGNVDPEKAKKVGKQYGADFILTGALSSIIEQSPSDSTKAVTYQTVLQLTNIESAELEWTDNYKIRKTFKRGSVGL